MLSNHISTIFLKSAIIKCCFLGYYNSTLGKPYGINCGGVGYMPHDQTKKIKLGHFFVV
jgi:hypothetical protein